MAFATVHPQAWKPSGSGSFPLSTRSMRRCVMAGARSSAVSVPQRMRPGSLWRAITQGMIHGSGRMCTAPLPFSTLRAFVAADQPGCRQRVQLERLLERFAV